MPFFLNIGYSFKRDNTILPDGSIILASAMSSHQLVRRKIDKRYPHLANRLFDPQLYLASVDANASKDICAKLSTYPIFGTSGVDEYNSSIIKQKEWMNEAKRTIGGRWTSRITDEISKIESRILDSINFQLNLGCNAIILPAPLTSNISSGYNIETMWLDSGIKVASNLDLSIPVYATIAISDICLVFENPEENILLDTIADVVSSREVDGVYIVLEQSQEPEHSRQCSNQAALHSILYLCHSFKHDADKKVVVNFLGAFGLVCRAVGADIWCSDWYKSLYRLRIADKKATGRAFPSYWSRHLVADVHLKSDFDDIAKISDLFQQIADSTTSSAGLIENAYLGESSNAVSEWEHKNSNVSKCKNHFALSLIQMERELENLNIEHRLDYIESWLSNASQLASRVANHLGRSSKTQLNHIDAWLNALRSFRLQMGV